MGEPGEAALLVLRQWVVLHESDMAAGGSRRVVLSTVAPDVHILQRAYSCQVVG